MRFSVQVKGIEEDRHQDEEHQFASLPQVLMVLKLKTLTLLTQMQPMLLVCRLEVVGLSSGGGTLLAGQEIMD